MNNWRRKILNNIKYFDAIGYFKLIRFLSRGFLNYAASDDQMAFSKRYITQCNQYMDILAIRYNFEPVRVSDSYNLNNLPMDILNSIIEFFKVYDQLEVICDCIREDATIEDLKKVQFPAELMTETPDGRKTKYCIVKLNDITFILNGLVKLYLISKKSNYDLGIIVDNLHVMRDNYIPKVISDYLTKELKKNVFFGDDCLGSNYGTSVCMYFTTLQDTIANPVLIAPISGGVKGIRYNLFNCPAEKSEFTMIAEVIFGIPFEEFSPQKHFLFIANRVMQYSMASDLDGILTKLSDLQLTKNHILQEIRTFKGSEITTNLVFNTMFNILYRGMRYGEFNLKIFDIYENNSLYFKAYRRIYTIEYYQLKNFLTTYILSYFTHLSRIARRYLKETCGINGEDIIFGTDQIYNTNEIWSEEHNLNDISDYRGICLWVLYIYNEYCKVQEPLSDLIIERCLKIINLFLYYPMWYLNLIKDSLHIDKYEVESYNIDGSIKINLVKDNKIVTVIKTRLFGAFCASRNEAIVELVGRASSFQIEKLRSLLPMSIVTSFSENLSLDNFMLKDDYTIILINPDTYGCYFVDLSKLKLDRRYPICPEQLEISKVGDTIQVISNKVYTTTLDSKTRVYLLKRETTYNNLTSNLGGYKSCFFQKEGNDL